MEKRTHHALPKSRGICRSLHPLLARKPRMNGSCNRRGGDHGDDQGRESRPKGGCCRSSDESEDRSVNKGKGKRPCPYVVSRELRHWPHNADPAKGPPQECANTHGGRYCDDCQAEKSLDDIKHLGILVLYESRRQFVRTKKFWRLYRRKHPKVTQPFPSITETTSGLVKRTPPLADMHYVATADDPGRVKSLRLL
jgi:hypothetical protein